MSSPPVDRDDPDLGGLRDIDRALQRIRGHQGANRLVREGLEISLENAA
jgi:hypothetical protein